MCFCSSKQFRCLHEKYTKNTGRTVTCLWYCNKGYDPASYSNEIKILELTLILGTFLDFPVVNTPCFHSRGHTGSIPGQCGVTKEHNRKKKKRFSIGTPLIFVVVQLLSRVWLFAMPRTTTHQVILSFIISQSLLKPMSIELIIPPISSSVTLFSCPQSFPASGSFPMSRLFASDN